MSTFGVPSRRVFLRGAAATAAAAAVPAAVVGCAESGGKTQTRSAAASSHVAPRPVAEWSGGGLQSRRGWCNSSTGFPPSLYELRRASNSRDANTGAGQGFIDLAAAVQLRLRVAFI